MQSRSIVVFSHVVDRGRGLPECDVVGVKDADETLDVITEKDPDLLKRKKDRELMEQRQRKELEKAK